jgi:hypothetical protein
VLSHVEHLYPEVKGRFSANGGYWEKPAPVSLKICLKTGNVFDWEQPTRRRPIGNLFTVFGYSKELGNFKRVFKEMQRWCEEIEEAGKFVPDDQEKFGDPKETVFIMFLQNKHEQIGPYSALQFRKMIAKVFEGLAQDQWPIVFQQPHLFLGLLEDWANTGDDRFFTVIKKERQKMCSSFSR